MLTDGAATSATGNSPVFTSASYSFVSGDVGASVFIAAGTNWVPGWYKISSVASGAATLDATVTQAVLYPLMQPSTSAGCATTASPSGATWSIDYSQQASAQVSFTDLVIGATNTQLASAGNPFGKQWVGNIIQVNSGTGFTTGFYTLASVSGTTATMDRAVGTASSTGGAGALGGALASLSNLFTSSNSTTIAVAGNRVWQTGTQTITSELDFAGTGAASNRYAIAGYGSVRGDGTRATITTATNSIKLLAFHGVTAFEFSWFDFTSTAGTPGDGAHALSSNSTLVTFRYCLFSGFNVGINGDYTVDYCFPHLHLFEVEVKNSVSHGVINSGHTYCYGCYFHGNGGDGARLTSDQGDGMKCYASVFASNSGNGFNDQSTSNVKEMVLIGNSFYDNTDACCLFDQSSSCVATVLINNILYGGTYGFDFSSPVTAAAINDLNIQVNNAFGNNSSGARSSGAPGGGGDVTLTGNPFNNAGSGDFSLNGTAGAGAACTGAGWQASDLI